MLKNTEKFVYLDFFLYFCTQIENTTKAKPFVKWVGGKTQLIDRLEALLPADFDEWENVTYIDPFVEVFCKKCTKICTFQKFVVPLQRETED